MIDTHSHIQFKAFDKNRDEVIERAKESGITKIIAVGTDLESSRKTVEIAEKYPEVFASVGIHPHHLFAKKEYKKDLEKIEKLINHPKIVAVGETGIDKYIYTKTKYKDYKITEDFLSLQKEIFRLQIKLAIKYNKALIIHNIGTVDFLLEVLGKNWDKSLVGHAVFHCCEPEEKLLEFAKKHHVFIGIDGDITYYKKKQEFIKKVPLELLVLETDSPFISPEPKNLINILEFISKLLNIKKEKLEKIIYKNSNLLFKL